MLCKRIIPCLDIKDGRVVKGVNFSGLRDAGDPIELAELYSQGFADELVLLDISATLEGRSATLDLVGKLAQRITIPFTVGGGINATIDAKKLIRAGADKVAINTAAYIRPALIAELANEIGSQAVIIAIDTYLADGLWRVATHSGSNRTMKLTLEWIKEVESLGAGEILLTAINHDGAKKGFALDLIKAAADQLHLPLIASGGAGGVQDFVTVFNDGGADAALAASIFHSGELSVFTLKQELIKRGIHVRT